MAEEGTTEPTKGKEIAKARPVRMPTPFEEMERMLMRLSPLNWLRPMRWDWPSWGEMALPLEGRLPNVDIIDRDTEIVVRAELPGVEKKDLDVAISDNTVTIKASSKQEQKEEKGDYYRSEIRLGAIARTVTLPGEVDAEKARATLNNGVLELSMPKAEKARKRSIQIE